ncbi:MAG TPA: hypothetical protein VNY29_14025 [Terriglobales bacterium]|nr:hypothetical protein [Terriglobales bacterium]
MQTTADQVETKPKTRSTALLVALCALGVVLFVSVFRWTLVEYLTPFLEPLFEMVVGVFFIVALIWSLVHLIKAWKSGLVVSMLPSLVCLGTAAIAVFVPFTALTTDLDFRFHYAARTAVVNDVLAGTYENRTEGGGGRGDLIALPAHLSYLSSGGGEIVRFHHQDRTLILFFSFRGVLDSFSGFVYSSDDIPPTSGDFGGQFAEVSRLRKNWFWAASRN